MQVAHTFVPRRRVAITPRDAPLGEPYHLARHQLCEACMAAIVKLSETYITHETRASWLSQVVGTMRDIRNRESCQLCKLVVRAIQDLCPPYAREATRRDDEIIKLSVHGRQREVAISGSRFIANLKDVRDIISEGAYLESPLDGREEPPLLPHCSCCCTPLRLCRVSSQINLETVQSWLRDCESHHQCGVQGDHNSMNECAHPSLLVDVKSRNLVLQQDTVQRYCSLSYVYGNSNPFRTTRANLSILRQPGALDDPELPLPATIKEAMTIVEGIGENYLWVDSLCIVHDDNDFLQNAIKSMGEFYRNSILTIAVVSTSAASEHIPGVLPGSRHPLPWIEVGGTQIFATPVPLHLDLKGSKYESRAWTYQERLLSTRTLYITKNMAYYHCLKHGRSELNRDLDFSSDLNPLYGHGSRGRIQHGGLDTFQERSEWTTYFELVRKYSQKELTYPSDELAAFAGISGMLSSIYNTKFFAGLPTSALLIGLHWIPGYDKGMTHEPSSERREGFPSWSWASRDGPVEWLEAVALPGWWEWEGMGLPDPMTDIRAASLDRTIQIRFRSQVSSLKGLSAELNTAIVYSENLLDPGVGCPMPLIKVFDSQGHWCGRICHSSPSAVTSSDTDELGLMLLSTCVARKCNTRNHLGIHNWEYLFDRSVFPITREGGKLARLCNLLLIEYKEDGYAERRALCQIHADVWETMERKAQDVILI